MRETDLQSLAARLEAVADMSAACVSELADASTPPAEREVALYVLEHCRVRTVELSAAMARFAIEAPAINL